MIRHINAIYKGVFGRFPLPPKEFNLKNMSREELSSLERQLMDPVYATITARRFLSRTGMAVALLAPVSPTSALAIAVLSGAWLRPMKSSFRPLVALNEYVKSALQCGRAGDLDPRLLRMHLLANGNLGMKLARFYGVGMVAQAAIRHVLVLAYDLSPTAMFEPMISLPPLTATTIAIWAALATGSLAVFPGGVEKRAATYNLPPPSIARTVAKYGGTFAALGAGMVWLAKTQ